MQNAAFLQNKTALITGASGGIGKEIGRKIAGYGMNLLLAGRSRERLEAAAQLARETSPSGSIEICCADLTEDTAAEQVIQAALQRFGRLDVLVNCAGIAQHSAFEEVTPQEFDRIMAANVRAPYFLCQKALPALRRSDCATILNICSVVAHKGYPMQSVYAASKHALLGLSKSLANEVYRDGIRVHVISPGAVYTDMVALARPDLSPEGMTLPEDIADIAGFYLEHRQKDAVIDEIQVHRTDKAPFA